MTSDGFVPSVKQFALSHVPLICGQINPHPHVSAAPPEEARSAASAPSTPLAAAPFPRLVSILYGY